MVEKSEKLAVFANNLIIFFIFIGVKMCQTEAVISGNPKAISPSLSSRNFDGLDVNEAHDPRGEAATNVESFSAAEGYRWNSKAEADREEERPFKLLGQGSAAARVVDASGEVLIGSTDKRGVYELAVSPGMKRLVVSLGDGMSKVLEPESGLEIDLPAAPNEPNVVGFSAWNWLSDDLLITTSGVQALDEAGKPVSCCDGHNLSATQLYAYRISTRSLSPVKKPDAMPSPVFTIKRVSHDGLVEMIGSETHSGEGKHRGWFQPIIR